MAALSVISAQNHLYEELQNSQSVRGKRIDHLYDFLSKRGITTLSEVTSDTLEAFLHVTYRTFALESNKQAAYKGDLETVYFEHMKQLSHPLTKLDLPDRASYLKKAITYLMASGIKDIADITAEIRVAYESYLMISVPAKCLEYLKVLDKLKLSTIEEPAIKRDLLYKNELLFLLYYPDKTIADTFYYTAKKDFLFFDFRLPGSVRMKKQIFEILKSDISKINEGVRTHYLLQQMITPLYYLYNFCVVAGIDDIKQINDEQEAAFKEYLSTKQEGVCKTTSQVLLRAKKFLFLFDERPDFTANTWFMERFTLNGRVNPARGSINLNFGDISVKNRTFFQHYMKYLLVLSPKYSFQSILEKYYIAKEFIRFLDRRNGTLEELSYSDIQDYIEGLDERYEKPETYNRSLAGLSSFLTTLSVREKLLVPSFPMDLFYKKAFYLHHDRSVADDEINRILSVLSDFPETLGLMYLTIYSTGLRINEVCSLEKTALFQNDSGFWMSVYQYKMRREKQIPIPSELYRLLSKQIAKDDSDSIYIFPSCTDKSKPYRAATFTKQMKQQLLLYEETKDIKFKSHDYRHTMATNLHNSGAAIATTRAFLGHTRDDMTKQYIDHLPGHIELMQDKYFKENHDETGI